MPWILDDHWSTDFQLCSNFPNLDILELRPCRREYDADLDPTAFYQLGYFEAGFAFPSVSTLVWNMSIFNIQDNWQLYSALSENPAVVPFLSKILPGLRTLKFFRTGIHFAGLLAQCLDHFPKISSLSILTDQDRFTDNGMFPILLHLPPHLTLTRLEFNVFLTLSGTWRAWNDVLAKLAPSLEHVTIRGVRIIWPNFDLRRCTLLVPILPRLKVFEVYISKELEWQFAKVSKPRILELQLNLVPAAPEQDNLDYGTQFPVLSKLRFKNEGAGSTFQGMKYPGDNTSFESFLDFLFSFFPKFWSLDI